MLSEIHHREKNNLALISSMLHLENYQSVNEETHKVLQNSQLRIQSMATVHEELYKTQDFSNLPFVEIVDRIISSIKSVYPEAASKVNIKLDIEEFELNINQAIPCTLILSELVGNTLKHAYWPGEEGSVEVSLREDEEPIKLRIKDEGRGLPA